jgi:hypothetical protein
MFRRILLCAACSVLVASAGTYSQESNVITEKQQAKPEDIRKLLKATNCAAMGKQLVDRMIDLMSDQSHDVPDSVWEQIRSAFDWEKMVDLLIPVYQRHLSGNDVKDLVKFFESKLGKRFIAAQPAMLQESMSIGQLMGADVSKKIREALIEKGYTPPELPH